MAVFNDWTLGAPWTYDEAAKQVVQSPFAAQVHVHWLIAGSQDTNESNGKQPIWKAALLKTDVSPDIIAWKLKVAVNPASKGAGYSVGQPRKLYYTTPTPRTRNIGRLSVLRHGIVN